MIIAFIIAVIVAIFFIILWSEERDRLKHAEQKLKLLTKENKRLKSKGGQAEVEKSRKTKGYALPEPERNKEISILDHGKLVKLQEQTRAAQDMLAEIFIREDDAVQRHPENSNGSPMIEILGKLFAKELWTREEVLEIAGPDVMVGNLLEEINDYAYPIINDIVVEEDGDNIYITTEYKEQLI